jgi:hypothetical protein
MNNKNAWQAGAYLSLKPSRNSMKMEMGGERVASFPTPAFCSSFFSFFIFHFLSLLRLTFKRANFPAILRRKLARLNLERNIFFKIFFANITNQCFLFLCFHFRFFFWRCGFYINRVGADIKKKKK